MLATIQCDGHERLIGKRVSIDEREHSMLRSHDRRDETPKAGARGAPFLARLSKNPPAIPIRRPCLRFSFWFNVLKDSFVEFRVARPCLVL